MAHFARSARGRRSGAAACIAGLFCVPLCASEPNCVATKAFSDFGQENRRAFEAPGDDKRFVLPRERAAFHAFDRVGAVAIKARVTQQRWRKSGSGTLINACYVLTSYHVVFPDFVGFNAARSVMFSFGVPTQAGKPFKYAIEGAPVDLGLFDPQRPVHLLDQVLIRLKERVPAPHAPIDFTAAPAQDYGVEVYACGFPGELNTFKDSPQSLYCDKCQVKGYARL